MMTMQRKSAGTGMSLRLAAAVVTWVLMLAGLEEYAAVEATKTNTGEDTVKTTDCPPVELSVRVRRNGRETQGTGTGTGNDVNRTSVDEDYHKYYRAQYFTLYPPGSGIWLGGDAESKVHTIANGLPGRNMGTKNVRLSFDFPFYGSPIRNITITVKGFVSMGSVLSHSLASTQYVAPLMANFDPGLDPMSVVKYRDNGTALRVEWERLRLRDDMEGRSFTFQVTLTKSGQIIFVYKEIPKPVTSIDDSTHPVRVGITDAYTVEALMVPFYYVHRKTIYEYHTIELDKTRVTTGSAIVLTPLPTCGQFGNCTSCLVSQTGFNCRWCPSLRRCSDGYDRSRQQWVDAGCDEQASSVKCRIENVPSTVVPSTTAAPRVESTTPAVSLHQLSTTTNSRLVNNRDDKSIYFPETTSNSRQFNVWQVAKDDPAADTEHRVTENINRERERTSYGIPQTLEIEVVICILVAVVIVVVAIAWIIHSYSRRPRLELFVVELCGRETPPT